MGRAALAVALGLLAAGCGGGSKAPSVASLAPSHGGTTTGTTQSTQPNAAPGPSGAGAQLHVALKVPAGSDGEKFSVCMRAHGLPTFPDPNGQGIIQLGSGSGLDPRSPRFQAAQRACRRLLPNGGQPTPAQIAKAQKAALAYSACMRKNGIKDFPDPTFSGGAVQLRIGGRPGSDLDPSSPLFQKAQAACRNDLPAK